MASLRKLRRRAALWSRYIGHYRNLTTSASDPWPHYPPGYWRAKQAVDRLEERRFWDETPEIWMGGPDGEAALCADVCDCGMDESWCDDDVEWPDDVFRPVETITVAGGVL